MQLQIFATVLASLAGSLVLADSTTGSVSGCSDISLNNYWLIANCTNDAGSLVSSGVYLPLHIANDNEVLTVSYSLLPKIFCPGKIANCFYAPLVERKVC